jgi:putative transposase
MQMKRKYPKKIRLPLGAYADPGSMWHVTLCTDSNVPTLLTAEIAPFICEQIEWYAATYDLNLVAYVVMPDHLHFVASVGDRNLVSMIDAFKSWTSKGVRVFGITSPLWQPSFHDRGLRQTDDVDAVVTYLYDNPVRAGLIGDQTSWPWMGGSALRPDPSA